MKGRVLLEKVELEAQTAKDMKTTNRVVIWRILVRRAKQINSAPTYTLDYTLDYPPSGSTECRSVGMRGGAVP